MRYATALTIAGSDSGGGAGIQADLKTFSALGVYGMSVITALTAQNTREVTAIHEAPTDVINRQMDAVMTDIGADAIKTGMMASPEIIAAVAGRLRHYRPSALVVDPVMVSTSGFTLLRDDAIEILKRDLIPLALVITPNLPEAEILLDMAISDEKAMTEAAGRLLDLGPSAVLLKGGHLSGASSNDILAERGPDGTTQLTWFGGLRIATRNTHGTGCTLSAAIAAYLAKGFPVKQAVDEAKRYLSGALAAGAAYTLGRGNGPVCHFYQQQEKSL
ncbi:MAG TPA: bifunctional hydroxymethylpyrimidine kinase/phosphomethylpyrimidine kinase [Kiritimatiellia bacterium]|nr:bifunctional hydroxymethylpyrimidine kinase/phosphomethylpyrimidine kinase [Kiritimatiellia bacterium]HMO99504.1 bifunctional hydroxymethylpyrimidine kinase/phosphomethylpyrimidine kinase [Kiritimatiellia bacterium]HMP97863.1 bifunctional hydroxymethylpyrimidine kinase/phosphomethylpyrimidine kinase [Kiritimatiellia bacterium]